MENLNELKITNIDTNLEYGFFSVEFEGGKSLQCCLVAGKKQDYIKAISKSDNGFNWGICGDCNKWAAYEDEDGSWQNEHINDFLISQARKAGLKIVA